MTYGTTDRPLGPATRFTKIARRAAAAVVLAMAIVLATAVSGPRDLASLGSDPAQAQEMTEEEGSHLEIILQALEDSNFDPAAVDPPQYLLTGGTPDPDEVWEVTFSGQVQAPLDVDTELLEVVFTESYSVVPVSLVPGGDVLFTLVLTSEPIEGCGPSEVREFDLVISIEDEPTLNNPAIPNWPLNGASKVAALACTDGDTELQLLGANDAGEIVPAEGLVEVFSAPAQDLPPTFVPPEGTTADSHAYLFVTDTAVTGGLPWASWLISSATNQQNPTSFWVATFPELGAGTVVTDLTGTSTDAADQEASEDGSQATDTEKAQIADTEKEDDSSDDELWLWALAFLVLLGVPFVVFLMIHRSRSSNPPSEKGEALLSDGASDDRFIS